MIYWSMTDNLTRRLAGTDTDTDTDTGLRAKDLRHALHLDDQPNHVQTMRAKLKRLVGRDLLTEPEPGPFLLNRPDPDKPLSWRTDRSRIKVAVDAGCLGACQ
jgi:hypothetical protein